ncbi:hypothetical protein Syun_002020 [Stephania yunnanensis]|uniref:Uncharacterized protein n=1 Tax=Stephania yunnanensis TaxID=152371 RepID=A0AAP0LFT0_9MAGN
MFNYFFLLLEQVVMQDVGIAITGDSIVLKFEKARSALEESLKRVEDIILDTSCSYLGFSLNLIKQINSMKENAVNLMPQNSRSFILNTEEAGSCAILRESP